MSLSVPLNQWTNQQVVLEKPTEHSAASLPVPNPSRSYWIDTPHANPLAGEGSEGPLVEDADICIIGSGITGVSAGYHLSKELEGKNDTSQPISAIILEARDFCSGATGRNGGHLTPAKFLDFVLHAKLYGNEEALKLLAIEKYTAAEITKILRNENLVDAVDLVEGSRVNLLFSDEEVKEAKADFIAAQSAGADLSQIEWLSKDDMQSLYGTSYPAIRYPGANLWPLKLVTQLFFLTRRSTAMSLNLHTRTPVTSIHPIIPSTCSSSMNRRWSLTTPRGSISCTYVIHATNAYASHLLPNMKGPDGIIPTRGQALAIRSNTTTSELTKASWVANEGFEYWFPRPVKSPSENPLVILGGGREAAPSFETYVDDDSVVNENVGRTLRDFLPGVFPGKFEEGREPEMEWTGIMGYTKTGDPFVGPVMDKSGQHEGQFIAAGYSGHGMPRTFACAQVVARMVLADVNGVPWNAPEWLPKHFLTWERIR